MRTAKYAKYEKKMQVQRKKIQEFYHGKGYWIHGRDANAESTAKYAKKMRMQRNANSEPPPALRADPHAQGGVKRNLPLAYQL